MKSLRDTQMLLIILTVALAIRIIAVIPVVEKPSADAKEYDRLATEILKGNGYVDIRGHPTSFRPPLYPFFLAGIFYLAGHNYTAVRVVQAFLGTLLSLVIYFIAKEAFSKTIGLISVLFSSFYLSFVTLTKYLFTENLFILFFAIVILCLLKIRGNLSIRDCGIAGFALGLAALIRPIVILFPIFIFFHLLINSSGEKIKKRLVGLLVLLFFFILPILPWTLRNWYVHRAFIPISTQGGLNFYQSVRPVEDKIFGLVPDDEIIRKSKKLSSEVESNRFLFKEGLRIYRQEKPIRLLKFFALRIAYFWSPFDWEILRGNIYNYHFVFILLFSIMGMYILRKRWKELLPLYLAVLYFLSSVIIFQGAARYRLPIDPYFIIFAAYAIHFLFKKYSNKIFSTSIILSWFGINFLLYLNSDFTKEGLKKLFQSVGLW